MVSEFYSTGVRSFPVSGVYRPVVDPPSRLPSHPTTCPCCGAQWEPVCSYCGRDKYKEKESKNPYAEIMEDPIYGEENSFQKLDKRRTFLSSLF